LEADTPTRHVEFDSRELGDWDSGLLIFLRKVIEVCAGRQIQVETGGLPDGVKRLLDLAAAVPEKKDARKGAGRKPFFLQVGEGSLAAISSTKEMLAFIGEASIAFVKLLGGKARFRRRDLWLTIQECGAQALPIATLISFLTGLILAFVGAVQLQKFGASIYVADLVAIAMVREFAAVMTAIIMAGRTGAAFAAELGTMTVNEEIDAFKTLGFSPMEFLVLPRMLALALMMPLLTMYANLVGIMGGLIVGVGMLDLSSTLYWGQTQKALGFGHLFVGLSKSVVFGVLVAVAGCLRGIQCGRSSAAVGLAATSAVVTGIVAIILTDALFAVITNIIGV
jgi:phospholipid/cholesterol/gamma-HCH transport system permease protein